jgi:hypothetical protein
MPETKYGKYIITERETRPGAPWDPKFGPDELTPMMNLDSGIVKKAFYIDTGWTLPAFAKETHGLTHKHDYDEVLAFFGSDPENPHNLYAEVDVHIGDEVQTVTKSFLLFIPKGVPHGPMVFKRIDKPIFHFSCGTGKKYF